MMLGGVRWWGSIALVALVGLLSGCGAVTIMSIDFGSEWMKIAVVAVSIVYDMQR